MVGGQALGLPAVALQEVVTVEKLYIVYAKRTSSPGRIFEKIDHRPLNVVALMNANVRPAQPVIHGLRRPAITAVAK